MVGQQNSCTGISVATWPSNARVLDGSSTDKRVVTGERTFLDGFCEDSDL